MNKNSLIEQKPFRALSVFALPIIIGSLFQQFYTMADSAIVGKYVNADALGAIGASTSLTNVFIWFAIGAGVGAGVIVGHSFGAGDYRHVKTATSTALSTALVFSIFLALIGLFASEQILLWLDTPDECIDMAVSYLQIYFVGLPFLFLYNMISNIFNALGRSRIPLYFLIFSSLFNIGLDYYMVVTLNMGIEGAAWATLIAQGISCVGSFFTLIAVLRRYESERFIFFERVTLNRILKVALPSILQQSAISIGMLLVQGVINSFGHDATAGFAAAARIESLAIVPLSSLCTAVSAYTSQNLGAGKPERVVEGYRVANYIVAGFCVVYCFCTAFAAGKFVEIFVDPAKDPSVYDIALGYARFIGFFFIFIGIKMIVDGVLRGAGDMLMFTVANIANLAVRYTVSAVFAPIFGYQIIWYAVPIGWATNFVISYIEYRTGKWRTSLKR